VSLGGTIESPWASRHATLERRPLRWVNPAWVAVAAAAGLTAFGVAAIGTTHPELASRQIAYAGVGVIALALAAGPDYRRLRRLWPLLAAASLVLLIVVLLPGVPESLVRPRNGARRWINLGITDFQPSELAKVAFVFAAAAWVGEQGRHRRLLGFAVPLLFTLVPVVLILAEPDLGTSLLFFPTLLAVLWCGGARKRHILAVLAAAVLAAPLSYPLLKPHQKARVDALLAQVQGDRRYEMDIGYQGARAMDLVGSGRLDGNGPQAAMLIRHNHLPEAHNDMVFAVVACRWGFAGGALMLGLFATLVAAGLGVALQCRDAYGRLLAIGAVSMIAVQAAVNVAMTVGVAPITGMTLPLVSFGGSSLVASWVLLGLLVNVGLRRPPRLAPRRVLEFGAVETRR
jgi:cell division protein FtsW (lipid II flippase)